MRKRRKSCSLKIFSLSWKTSHVEEENSIFTPGKLRRAREKFFHRCTSYARWVFRGIFIVEIFLSWNLCSDGKIWGEWWTFGGNLLSWLQSKHNLSKISFKSLLQHDRPPYGTNLILSSHSSYLLILIISFCFHFTPMRKLKRFGEILLCATISELVS